MPNADAAIYRCHMSHVSVSDAQQQRNRIERNRQTSMIRKRHANRTTDQQRDWLKILTHQDMGVIVEKCGLLCIGRLSMTNGQLNKMTKTNNRIAATQPNWTHEHHVFSTQLEKEKDAERRNRERRVLRFRQV